jgi:Tol biopolymer transport system component
MDGVQEVKAEVVDYSAEYARDVVSSAQRSELVGVPVNTSRTWRFGVFELDTSSGELRRNGTVAPSFSPDGRQIAFVWDGVERRHYDIYVQLVGGDTPLQLTHHKRGDGLPGPPQWSPDGREIAFARCNSERDGVYTVPALGGAERRLTNSPCRDWVAGPALLDSGQQRHGDARPLHPSWSARRCALLFRNRREALSGGGISRRLCLQRCALP